MSEFNLIIAKICENHNINYKLVSKDWIYILKKNGKVNFINGYKFSLNSQSVGNVLDDKYAFYEILKHFNFPIITHHVFFKNYNVEEANALFNLYNKKVVLKANLGTCGTEVFYIDESKKLKATLDKLLISNFSVSLCPYYEIKAEYRTIILDNEVKVLYGKKRPIVIGDDKSTKKELLLKEFKTIDNIREADVNDLLKVKGITFDLAKKIKDKIN